EPLDDVVLLPHRPRPPVLRRHVLRLVRTPDVRPGERSDSDEDQPTPRALEHAREHTSTPRYFPCVTHLPLSQVTVIDCFVPVVPLQPPRATTRNHAEATPTST